MKERKKDGWMVAGIRVIAFFIVFYVATLVSHSGMFGIAGAFCFDIVFLYSIVKKKWMKESKMFFTNEQMIMKGMIPMDILGIILFIYIFLSV